MPKTLSPPRRRPRPRWARALWPTLMLLAVPASGQEAAPAPSREATTAELPRVHVLATGGTIAGAGYDDVDTRSAEGLLRAIPELANVARLSAEDPFTIPSSQITPEMLFGLAQKIRQLLEEDPELAGIVVTQGTDSLEEAAFFCDLLSTSERPVVFTGAMRSPEHRDSDGARNLLGAVRLAASPAARGLGVLVTLNDEIHAAREIRKVHSSAVNAFASPGGGPIGYLDDERIYLLHRPLRRVTIATEKIEPKVDLIVVTAGSDGHLVRAAVAAGARGLVVELFGRGNMPRPMIQAVIEARQQGVTVVYTTRARGGAMKIDQRWTRGGMVYGEDLDGLKARMLLVVALGATQDPAVLQGYFDRLAGRV